MYYIYIYGTYNILSIMNMKIATHIIKFIYRYDI